MWGGGLGEESTAVEADDLCGLVVGIADEEQGRSRGVFGCAWPSEWDAGHIFLFHFIGIGICPCDDTGRERVNGDARGELHGHGHGDFLKRSF